jgi:hypothetical protein
MPISSEDLAIGRQANTRIKNYERQKSKRVIAYLFPAIWAFGSIVRYEAQAGTLFQIIFWSLALVAAIIFGYKRKKTYLHDLATLEGLRKQYGADVSLEEQNVVRSAGEMAAIKESAKWKGLEPLFAVCLLLAVVFILPHIFHYFMVAFSK